MINIDDLIPLLKPGWIVFTRNGNWFFYRRYKPKLVSCINIFGNEIRHWESESNYERVNLSDLFNIAPFDRDWKDSLIEIKEKEGTPDPTNTKGE